MLAITRGSLTDAERREIQQHVMHTFQFLAQIPWTRELRRVPEIAHSHHEKLDGSGYPFGVRGEQIPVQSRMMAIADIYDALTATDRPYKKAVRVEEALDILRAEQARRRARRGAARPLHRRARLRAHRLALSCRCARRPRSWRLALRASTQRRIARGSQARRASAEPRSRASVLGDRWRSRTWRRARRRQAASAGGRRRPRRPRRRARRRARAISRSEGMRCSRVE